ncbi:MAG: putative membrane protein YkoI [Oleiphilaceae bacterium]|jgi:uncharacterized membrane protein YkoI
MIFTFSLITKSFKILRNIMPYSHISTGLYVLSIALFSSTSFGSDAYFYTVEKNYSPQITNKLLLASNNLISADQAAKIAKQGKASKVLKISKKAQGNRDFYRVKLLTQKGHIRLIHVDARSGEIVQGNK